MHATGSFVQKKIQSLKSKRGTWWKGSRTRCSGPSMLNLCGVRDKRCGTHSSGLWAAMAMTAWLGVSLWSSLQWLQTHGQSGRGNTLPGKYQQPSSFRPAGNFLSAHVPELCRFTPWSNTFQMFLLRDLLQNQHWTPGGQLPHGAL